MNPKIADRIADDRLSVERLLTAWRERWGADPKLVASAPGRVNLMGDHVDYAGGLVLPMAIDRRCWVAVDRNGPPDRIVMDALDLDERIEIERTEQLEPGQNPQHGHWSCYPLGVAATLLDRPDLAPLRGTRWLFTSDVPRGGGISSSAAIELCTAFALSSLLDLDSTREDLARICQQAEHDYAGVPCGLMDQMVAAVGRQGHLLFMDCRDDSFEYVRAPDPREAAFVVIETGVAHALNGCGYARCRSAVESGTALLGVKSLREIDPSTATSAVHDLPERVRDACQHVIAECERVTETVAALQAGDLSRVGQLMYESHASLRDLMGVSCGELEAIIAGCQQIPGVYGARMTGAGFGGSAIALAHPDAIQMAVTGARCWESTTAWACHSAEGAQVVLH